MTRQQLSDYMREKAVECLNLAHRKNKDYSIENDAFLNFRHSEVVGVSPERAILIRIMDKITRISNLLDKQATVSDETVDDTIKDTVNYLLILSAMLSEHEG
jgi:hypothetical protein